MNAWMEFCPAFAAWCQSNGSPASDASSVPREMWLCCCHQLEHCSASALVLAGEDATAVPTSSVWSPHLPFPCGLENEETASPFYVIYSLHGWGRWSRNSYSKIN
jgi:hypothetical protein